MHGTQSPTERVLSEKKPRLFLEWPESGEGAALVAERLSDLEHGYGILDDLRELLTGDYKDGETVVICRTAMTDEEVAALPDL